MQNRIDQLFEKKNKNILSVYFTAGFPGLDDTVKIICELQDNGVDLIEIGMPFSDPTADGPTLQYSNNIALKNGMSLRVLFKQLEDIREKVNIPLILMGYTNPVIQFGVEAFCTKCKETGIDGIILPDLPLEEYKQNYSELFNNYDLYNILLVSPNTRPERIVQIDSASKGFIYIVSSASTTGAGKKSEDFSIDYFQRLQGMRLKNPGLIGFGISDRATFENACNYAQGAIVGSAFIDALKQDSDFTGSIKKFVNKIRGMS
ncbi:MAG: tryptophan synthase subunit alpha [Prolixibacteraceae bacterium]|jgi:tryptophan synthase alpha chain|nr:tryptophan synthase subunit alpha [Prolixibacteraceae bacterium]